MPFKIVENVDFYGVSRWLAPLLEKSRFIKVKSELQHLLEVSISMCESWVCSVCQGQRLTQILVVMDIIYAGEWQKSPHLLHLPP